MSGFERLLAGRTLVDRYRIEEVIGRGGFAVVYRATDERLERTVAVKVIVLAAPDAEARQQLQARFHREARIAASLQHPNVVTVYDFGTDNELELDFLVMELLRGEDLATRLRRAGPPALKLAVRIVRDAAWGLAAGHRAGMIHRDVKPGNIFLATQDRPGRFRVCMLDFGIAQIKVGDAATPLTRGPAPLSPAYASPEQLRGEREFSPASDVFSLGVVGYQLFTGERPFSPEQTDRGAALRTLPKLRTRNPAVTPELEAVIHRALAFAPEERFPDAAAMGEALDAAYAGVQMGAPEPAVVSPGTSDALESPESPPAAAVSVRARPAAARRHAAPSRLWGAVGLALVAVLGALWALGRGRGSEAEPAPRIAQREAPAPSAPNVSDAPNVPSASNPETAQPPSPAAQPPRAGTRPNPAGTPSRGPATGAPVRPTPPAARPQSGPAASVARPRQPAATPPASRPAPARRVPALPTPVRTAPVRTTPASPTPASPVPATAASANQQGESFFERGNNAVAVALFRRAVQMEPNNPYYRNNLGWALLQAGQVDAAASELAETVRLDPRRAIAYANIGEVRLVRGDTAGAIAAYEQFLELNTNPRREEIARRKVRRLRGVEARP